MTHSPVYKDLALIYVGLAQGVDGQLHFRELGLVKAFLNNRMPSQGTEDASVLIDDVLRFFEDNKPTWKEEVRSAVDRLSGQLPDEEKRSILAELSQIGLADHKFLHAEAAFLQEVQEAWKVSLIAGQPDNWSILGEGGIQGEALRSLAILYLCVAFIPDEEINPGERDIMIRKLKQWIPGSSTAGAEAAIRDAMARFVVSSPEENVRNATKTIKRLVPSHQLLIIFDDLTHIAQVDQAMLVEEKSWLQKIAEALGLRDDS